MNSILRFFRRRARDPQENPIKVHKMLVKRAEKKLASLWVLYERTPTDKKGELRKKLHEYRDTLRVYGNLSKFSRITIAQRIDGLIRLHHLMKATKELAEKDKLSLIGAWIQNIRERRDRARELEVEQEAIRQHFNGQRIHIH